VRGTGIARARRLRGMRPGTIYGGSSEIQCNFLAKYVLRLPSQ
jgi:alkylation response protein AidB-like acyl-CoA dehydrogenase